MTVTVARAPAEVVELPPERVDLVASIDRSEHVEVEYTVEDGHLATRPVTVVDVPAWDPDGTGPHSVFQEQGFAARALAEGGDLFGVFDDDHVAGLAIVVPRFEPDRAWLAFLHVSRPSRRTGVASALWTAAAERARAAGATSIYVSATPTGSAVGFYLAQGAVLAAPVHPRLYAAEPDDIHLVAPLT